MKLTLRECIGAPIRDHMTRGVLERVRGAVIHPDTGEILALFAGTGERHLIPTIDILKVNPDGIWIADPEIIATTEDIVRIRDVIAARIPILKNRVFTTSRHFLGEVVDIHFDTKTWMLTHLAVARPVLGIPTQAKLIAHSQIIRITKSEITVADGDIKTPATEKEVATPLPTANLTTACHDA